MLKTAKKVLFFLLLAVCCVLQAALILWFWPVILQEMASGQWQRRRVFIKKIHRIREQVRYEIYLRRQREARAKRVWENSNSFFKQSETRQRTEQRESWHTWLRKENETRAKRLAERRDNFYK